MALNFLFMSYECDTSTAASRLRDREVATRVVTRRLSAQRRALISASMVRVAPIGDMAHAAGTAMDTRAAIEKR
jgi:hypothetical protein